MTLVACSEFRGCKHSHWRFNSVRNATIWMKLPSYPLEQRNAGMTRGNLPVITTTTGGGSSHDLHIRGSRSGQCRAPSPIRAMQSPANLALAIQGTSSSRLNPTPGRTVCAECSPRIASVLPSPERIAESENPMEAGGDKTSNSRLSGGVGGEGDRLHKQRSPRRNGYLLILFKLRFASELPWSAERR
jgi:hypothetical protein